MSDEYYELWNDFRCWQNTRLWSLMREAAREANPEADFRIYSGAPGPFCRQAYGVDWSMAAKVIDVAMGGHGINSEGPARKFYTALEAGGRRIPLLMSDVLTRYMHIPNEVWRRTREIGNRLMQTVIQWDALGVALYQQDTLDSQFNAPLRETAAIFAQYEDLLTGGRHKDNLLSVKPEQTEYAAWQSADGRKITGFFFNNSEKPLKVTVSKTDEATLAGKKLKFTIPAWSRKIVEFGK